jgi:hypothetical protein
MTAVRGKSSVLVLVVLAAVCCGGCGTICNFASDRPQPFGGLAKDAEALSSASNDSPGLGGLGGDARVFLLFVGLGAAELCATGTADALTLPYFWWRDGWLRGPAPPVNKEYFNLPIQYSVGAARDPARPYRDDDILTGELLESLRPLGAPPPAPPTP